MTAQHYTIAAYVLVAAMLWGYAAHLVVLGRALKRKEARVGGKV